MSNQTSDERFVEYGIIQGSTLCPMLVLINSHKLEISGELFLFAVDTAMVFEGNTWKDVVQTVNLELAIVKSWFDKNSLTMNDSKTKCLSMNLRNGGKATAGQAVTLHGCCDYTGTA